jgi:hypothetical protein
MKPSDTDYQGSKFNIQVEWKNGECTFEALNKMIEIDEEMCYASEIGII